MGKIEEALKKLDAQNLGTAAGQAQNAPVDKKNYAEKAAAEHEGDTPSPVSSQGNEPATTTTRMLKQGPVDFRVVVYHNPESLAAEHFKVLRGNIMHPADGKGIKSVLITSALEQEGKTMVACNLAVSIAQSLDPYVMLIDADVRRPNVHNMLGLSKVKGLTDYLESDSPLSEYLIKCNIDKMTILQAGSLVRNPAEIMTSEKMKYLVKEVRQRYEDRFVVIDSPPVNLAAETLVLAQQVDAIVMVVRYGISDKNAVDEALNRLERGKILGMVFNGFEVTPRKYTYYKKRYHYGK